MKSSPCSQRHGFTLLEVVLGLTLMASVLVGSLLSFSAHQKQRRIADAKLEALRLADQLLNEMSASTEGIPVAGRGIIGRRSNWFWRTSLVGTASPAELPLRVVRLEIVEVTPQRSLLTLVTVEVVKPIEG